MTQSRPVLAVALAAAALFGACGGDEGPSTTPPPTTPATTQPAAPPPPSPQLPGQASCSRIGMGTLNTECGRFSPSFMAELNEAIDAVIRERPAVFENAGGGLRVNSPGQLYVGVIEKLDARGICADFDGEELQVKSSNAFNDQYHLVTSGFILRRGESSYRATCSPASFPTPAPPLIPTAGCALAPSRSLTCTRESPRFLAHVEEGLRIVEREHPEVFDFTRSQPGTDWPRIVDGDGYIRYILQAMARLGYCAIYDGEELAVKNSNNFNEQYDIWAGEGFSRRGEGAYRASCYPATF
jgi:hypothetical protein